MIRTVSLETAKALKKAGFRQRTGMYWANFMPKSPYILENYNAGNKYRTNIFSVPITDELLNLFPKQITLYRNKEKCWILNWWIGQEVNVFKSKSFPEALAAMWLYLKKEGLL